MEADRRNNKKKTFPIFLQPRVNVCEKVTEWKMKITTWCDEQQQQGDEEKGLIQYKYLKFRAKFPSLF